MKRKITISEQQIINAVRKIISEVRRNPLTNVDESFNDFFNRMIQKAPRENIFVSFREDTHVTDVNPKNEYRTPTGFYSYPLSSFDIYDDIYEKLTEPRFRRSFPFANDRKYINFFILKNHDGILTDKTDKSTLNMYVERIKKLYPNSSKVKELCDSFIDGSYSSDYNKTPVHDTHLFWLFLYDIAQAAQAGNTLTRINLICRKIGVNGFVDYEGHEYIHPAEPSQAVFFRVKSLGEVFTYEKPSISSVMIKRLIQEGQYKTIKNLPNGNRIIKLLDDYNTSNKYGIVDKHGNLVFKRLFERIDTFSDGFTRVRVKGMWNIINQNGEFLSKLWFDDFGSFKNGLAEVRLGGKGWNIINVNGELLSNQWFDYIYDYNDRIAKVSLNYKKYEVNLNNNSIVEIK